MIRAAVLGCAGPSLGADDRAFLSDAQPWGLILFKRNVVDRAQLRALTDDFRAIVGRADAPVLIDQEGGRVQRMGPPHWPPYPAAARFAATSAPERAAWLAARLIAADLFEVGISVDCAPVLDVAGEGMHAAIGARAFSDSAEQVGDARPRLCRRPHRRRRRAGRQAHARPRAGAGRQPPRSAGGDREPRGARRARLSAVRGAQRFADGDERAHRLHRDRRHGAGDDVAARGFGDHARRDRFDGLIFSDDTSMKALRGTFAEKTRAIFAAGLDIVLHCNGDLTEAREVVAETPELKGEALRRAEAALKCVAGGPQAFDAAAGRAELEALLATAPA